MLNLPTRRLSAFYACYFAILGTLLPYWALYLKDIGLSAEEIGQLSALLVASKIIAPYFWGWLADKTGQRLRLIRICTFSAGLVFAGFHYYHDFIWYACITLGFSFFWNASLPQFEAFTLQLLNKQIYRYNKIRLWGSIGFILAVLAIGQLLDNFSITFLPDIILVMMLLNWLVALLLPTTTPDKPPKTVKSLWQALAKLEIWAFFLVYLLLQIAHGPYYAFYSVYLHQHGYSSGLTGFFWALGVIAEIILFLFASRLLGRFNLRNLLLISLILSVIRWLMIAYLLDFIACLLIAQVLHAASFAMAHIVAIQYLRNYFGDQLQGQAQALYASISFGIGGMIGSLYSGYYWHSLGGSTVFAIAAAASALAGLIALIGVKRNL